MQVDHQIGGVEQDDQMLREIGDRVHLEIGIAQEDGACLRDAKSCSDDRKIYIRQIPRRIHVGETYNYCESCQRFLFAEESAEVDAPPKVAPPAKPKPRAPARATNASEA